MAFKKTRVYKNFKEKSRKTNKLTFFEYSERFTYLIEACMKF
jgi:hypothetical protein